MCTLTGCPNKWTPACQALYLVVAIIYEGLMRNSTSFVAAVVTESIPQSLPIEVWTVRLKKGHVKRSTIWLLTTSLDLGNLYTTSIKITMCIFLFPRVSSIGSWKKRRTTIIELYFIGSITLFLEKVTPELCQLCSLCQSVKTQDIMITECLTFEILSNPLTSIGLRPGKGQDSVHL